MLKSATEKHEVALVENEEKEERKSHNLET